MDFTARSVPHVSIIVLTYNQAENTIECLGSLRSVNYPNFSVVLVDNASSDKISDTVKSQFGEVTCLRSEINRGCGGGRNFGADWVLQNLPTQYLLFLDNDTVVDPDFLTQLITSATSNFNVGMVTSKLLNYYSRSQIDAVGNRVNLFSGKCPKVGHGEVDNGQYDHLVDITAASGCCQLIPVGTWRRLHGFDDYFNPFGYEDIDLCMRIKKLGLRIIISMKSVIFHKVSQTLGNGQYVSSYTKVKGKLMRRFLAKHARFYHWAGFFLIAPWLAIGTIHRSFRSGDPAAFLSMLSSFFGRKGSSTSKDS